MKNFFVLLAVIASLALTGCSAGETEQANADTGGGVTEATKLLANAEVSTNAEGTLTVAAVGDFNGYLEAAVQSFTEANENVNVEIVKYPQDITQYAQTVNTAIMSGAGEDVIDASYLAWQKLADKDKLVNLDEYIDFTDGEYFKAVLDAFLYKGKRFAAPVSFYFSAYGFTDAYVGKVHLDTAELNMDALLTLMSQFPDASLIYSDEIQNEADLADLITHLNYGDFIDIENKKADVDNEGFIEILNKAARFDGRIASKPEDNALLRKYQIFNPQFSAYTTEYKIDEANPNFITASSAYGTFDYSDMFLLTNDEGQSFFTPSDIMPAISANCERRQLAAGFVKHLLSAEAQTSPALMFSPVNREASALKAADATASGEDGGVDITKNIEMFDAFVNRLTFAKANDAYINGFIHEETFKFFEGRQTAEQTAANLQAKLTMYLNE